MSSNRVLVIHGNDMKARDSLFDFLHAVQLNPLEESELIALTGESSPYVGDKIRVGFETAQVTIVLLTPDDNAYLKKELKSEEDESNATELAGQARQNVLIQAGMSLALNPDKTILLQLGDMRIPSDLHGRDIIKLEDTSKCRHTIAGRLEQAGCEVNRDGDHWLTAGDFSKVQSVNSERHTSRILISQSYLKILSFAKLIHHEFHELHHQGWHEVGVNARMLFEKSSEGNSPHLILACAQNWAKSEEARNSINNNVMLEIDDHFEHVDDSFSELLHETSGTTRDKLAACYSAYSVVKKCINHYSQQIEEASKCFDENNDSLIESQVKQLGREAMAINMTVDRLISKADAIIRNLIGALEND